ncbi:MAG: YceI family protein, partial [Campylobacter sp.]|nr:YceI family protein [Campylobacter sp.]
ADKFPNMKFKMTEFIPKDDDEGVVKGELTIKDKTLPVELEYEFGGYNKLEDGTEKIGFSLEGEIDRIAFGVGEKSVALGSEVKLSIEVEANKKQ